MKEFGLHRLHSVIRRRKVIILVTTIGLFAVGLGMVLLLEPGYKAQAVIRIAEAQPAREYVPPTVAEQIGERLKSLRLTVMARPLVAQAARELRLVPDAAKADEVIDGIRSRMDVKVEGEDTFLLTYIDSSPERAQAIANRVAELFIRSHVERRKAVASATTQALHKEAEILRPEMEKADQQVRDFKVAHYGSLPEQQEQNLRTLDQTTMEINIQSTNLDLALEHRRQLLAGALSSLRHDEETLSGQLYDSRTKYTENHPEVDRIRAEYERVKEQRIADERELLSKARRENPELIALDGEIARTRSLLSALRTRQSDFRGRVEATAKNGQKLAGLTTQFERLRDKYTILLSRLRDAELAEGVERNLSSMRVDLVESASLPQHAGAPNRPLLGVGALFLALGLGIGVGFAVDAQDTTVRSSGDLMGLGPIPPILASIPHYAFGSTDGRQSRKPEA